MLNDNTLAASINAFSVQPSRDQLITLTIGQLSALITSAVEKAIQPSQDRINDLEKIVADQGEKIAALEATQDTQADNSLIQLRLINDLREAAKKEAQPLQVDRGKILRALLAANGGKMLSKDARKMMHLSESRFSELLATMQEYIDTKPYHLNKSAKILILK
jgi:hypothetical protein